jgi:hypothetical protein
MTGSIRRPRAAVAAALTGLAAVAATQAGLASPAAAADTTTHTSRPATAFTYVSSRHPATSYWNAPGADARVGLLSQTDGGIYRSYFRVPTDGLDGTTVVRARLRTTQTWSWSCQGQPVALWQTGPISSATTWRTQPAALDLVATVTPPGTNAACAAAQAVTFDVTQAVQDAADAGLPELTFALRAPNEAAVAQWHRFNKTVHLDVETAAVPADPAS